MYGVPFINEYVVSLELEALFAWKISRVSEVINKCQRLITDFKKWFHVKLNVRLIFINSSASSFCMTNQQ